MPVFGGLDDVTAAVRQLDADTVVVLSCPEMTGIRLRSLAWELEKTGTDLCVAPALLDVAGPRTTVRPAAGLTLLHVDHPRARRRPAGHEGIVRSAHCRGGADPAGPADAGAGGGDPALRPWAGTVHADEGGQGWAAVQDLQVPHHGPRRRAAHGESARERQPGRRPLQASPGSPHHPDRGVDAALVTRRATSSS